MLFCKVTMQQMAINTGWFPHHTHRIHDKIRDFFSKGGRENLNELVF